MIPPATPSARRRETRARLLDAASEVFAAVGLQGSTVEAICSGANFSRGAFYSNFESKEQLFLALLERYSTARAEQFAVTAQELEPELRRLDDGLHPEEAVNYIARFLAPTDNKNEVRWFVLETEFSLLAMRDPTIAPGYHDSMERFYDSITIVVERILALAGRRFTIPTKHALPVLSGSYEQALRQCALSGTDFSEVFDDLGSRIAELVFALTEPVPSPTPG